jgi:peptidoglycan/xylan/chitin deacetylase (PgdA/CDA1 family)
MIRPHLLVDAPLIACSIALGAGLGMAWALGPPLLASALHTHGVLNPRSSYYMPVFWRLPPGAAHCALTFDDGPHPEVTPRVLDALAEAGQTATFFVIGRNAEQHPDLLRRIHAEGHAIGLHSHSHSRLFNLSSPGWVRRDLQANGAIISDSIGEPPPRLFRPPVGLKNPIIGHISSQLDLVAVTWSGRAFDTRLNDPAAIESRLCSALAPRAILCMHDGVEPGQQRDAGPMLIALRGLLADMAKRGLRSQALQVEGRMLA